MQKNINDRLVLQYIALTILVLVGQGNCFSLQEPTLFLKQKLDSKIDINPYFLEIFEKQQQNKEYVCSYQEGPYCPLLSNATQDIVEDNFYSKNMRNYLKQKMYESHRLIESHQIKQKDFLPSQYYLDKSRALLDEELFYKPVEKDYPYKLLADFNVLEAVGTQQQQELKVVYTINLSSGKQIVSTTKSFSSEFLSLQFTDFYFFYPKKQAVNTQTQNLDRLDQLISVPSDTYILTNEKPGKIDFNLKLKIISFYVKINPAYTKYEKLSGQIKGYDFIKQADFSLNLNSLQNEFKLFKIETNHKINSITFSPYLIIDNIVVHIDKSDVIDANQYPEIDTDKNSTEIKDIIESFDKETFIYTNSNSSSKELSSDHPLRKGVRLTKEERKKKQKETIQKIKEKIPNQIQEKLYQQVEQKQLFDEEKLLEDLQKVLKKLSEDKKEIAQEVFMKQNINLDKQNNNVEEKKKEEDQINNSNIINQNKFNKKAKQKSLDKFQNNKKILNRSTNQKQTNDEKYYDELILDELNNKILEKFYDTTSKMYDSLRNKSPSVFGKLSNQQIEQKIKDGEYDTLLLEVIEETLNKLDSEEQNKAANKKKQTAQSSYPSYKIQENQSQKNERQTQKQNNINQQDKKQENVKVV
ncbi:hypothetical protein ABPG72_020998 [Tetrahymena utriculariae]